MTGKTISGYVTHTVTLGSASYASPLLITSTGTVAPTTAGAIGIYLPSAQSLATINNAGIIAGSGVIYEYNPGSRDVYRDQQRPQRRGWRGGRARIVRHP